MTAAGLLPPPLLRRLAECHDTAVAGELRRRCREIDAELSRPKVTIVFGGHFSCGKSSLINMLIGRPLLPTGDFPETGVPCRLRTGPSDEVRVITYSGESRLPFDTESIAEMVRLTGADGSTRTLDHVRQVEISLAGTTIPPGAEWLDSPGINDTAEMTERAAHTARRGDILIWVIDSRRPMSETERDFLAAHVTEHGPGSVLYVVNVFLTRDSAERWEWFLAERAPYHLARVREVTGQDSADVVFVSARAGAAHPDGFGAPYLRRLLAALSDPRHPRTAAARRWRAATRLTELAADVAARAEAAQASLDAARAEHTQRSDEHRSADRAFDAAVRRAVRRSFAEHRAAFDQCGQDVVDEISTGSLRRDDSYGRSLGERLERAAADLAAEVLDVAGELARVHDRRPLPARVRSKVVRLLTPREVTVEVPDTPLRAKGGGLGAVMGGALGTVLLPGLGTAIGAAIGGVLGASGQAAEEDVAGAKSNALQAAAVETSRLLGLVDRVAELLITGCPAARALPAPPDDGALPALRAVRETLLAQAEKFFAEAGR